MGSKSWSDKLTEFKGSPENAGLVAPPQGKTEGNWARRLETFQQGYPQTPVPVESPATTERFPVEATVAGISGTIAASAAGMAALPAVAAGSVTAGGGEAYRQLYEHATGSPDAPRTSLDAVTRIGKEMVFQGLADVAGRGVQVGLQALKANPARIFQREATPEGKGAISFTQGGMHKGGVPMADQTSAYAKQFLTPGEATGSKYQTVLNNLAEGSFLGGGVIKDFKANRQKYLQNAMERWSEQFGQTIPDKELGEAIVGSIQKNYQLNRAPARAAYGFLSQMTEPKPRIVFELEPSSVLNAAGKPIMRKVPKEIIDRSSGAWADMRPLKQFAKDEKGMADFLNGIAAEEGGDTLLAKLTTMGDHIPYAAAQKLRTRLQSVADVFSVENKRAPALGLATKASGMVDQAIDDGLAKFSPDARDIWRYANSVYKGASEEYNNEFLRNLIKIGTRRKDGIPEKVFDEVWKPGAISGISKLKTALDPATWKLFQGQAAQALLQRSSKDGVLDFHTLDRLAFSPKQGIGTAAMRETFGTENLTWLHKFVEAGKAANQLSPDKTGTMLIQLTQGRPVLEVFGGGLALFGIGKGDTDVTTAGIGVLLSPNILARLLTNPRTANLLIEGITTRRTAPAAASIMLRLAQTLFPRSEQREPPGPQPLPQRLTQVPTAQPMVQ